MLIGIVRVKFVAILLGPVGVGLIGTYNSIAVVATTLAGLGISKSGVREIASAKGDAESVARAVVTVGRISWLSGLVGALFLVVLSWPLSRITFGDSQYFPALMLLGLVVLFSTIRGGQMAVLQGHRRVVDLAKVNIIGTAVGALVSVGFYYIWGLQGVVPALIAMAGLQLLWSWLFARRVEVEAVSLSWAEVLKNSRGLLSLGVALMWSALMVAVVAYASRALIMHESGIEAVGIFSAAFAISGMVVNFVLQAMSADYYPRLTEEAESPERMCSLVNEQIEMGVLLAMPMILVTLSLAPLIIELLYSSEFSAASDLLRWFVLGCVIRIIQWPIGFITLALGKGALFGGLQTLFNLLHVGLLLAGLKVAGVLGVSIAYPLLYLVTSGIVYCVGRRLIDFRMTLSSRRLVLKTLVLVLLVFSISEWLPSMEGILLSLILSVFVSVYYFKELLIRIGPCHRISKIVGRVVPSTYHRFIWSA